MGVKKVHRVRIAVVAQIHARPRLTTTSVPGLFCFIIGPYPQRLRDVAGCMAPAAQSPPEGCDTGDPFIPCDSNGVLQRDVYAVGDRTGWLVDAEMGHSGVIAYSKALPSRITIGCAMMLSPSMSNISSSRTSSWL